MNIIYSLLNCGEIFRVSTCTTTEEMWDLIQVIDEGTPDATKRNYWRCPKRFNHIVNNLKGLGKVFEEGESNVKVLKSLNRT